MIVLSVCSPTWSAVGGPAAVAVTNISWRSIKPTANTLKVRLLPGGITETSHGYYIISDKSPEFPSEIIENMLSKTLEERNMCVSALHDNWATFFVILLMNRQSIRQTKPPKNPCSTLKETPCYLLQCYNPVTVDFTSTR